MTLNVTIWNEYRHEKTHEEVRNVYPDGLHTPIADHLGAEGMTVRVATLDEPEHGLTQAVLAETDVLTWWGHLAHADVSDEVVARVHGRVLEGMGLIVLHSAHFSKIFQRLMGTTCNLIWREANEHERVWVVEPGHPIAAGLGPYFEIPAKKCMANDSISLRRIRWCSLAGSREGKCSGAAVVTSADWGRSSTSVQGMRRIRPTIKRKSCR